MKPIEPIVAFNAEITALRREIHAHPELRYDEHRTSELVARKLTEWGIEVHRGLGKTGVVGVVRNGSSRDRKSTRLNSSHVSESRMPSSA